VDETARDSIMPVITTKRVVSLTRRPPSNGRRRRKPSGALPWITLQRSSAPVRSSWLPAADQQIKHQIRAGAPHHAPPFSARQPRTVQPRYGAAST
jgi:hypothetical protein